MAPADELPAVLPSAVDPDCECVLVDRGLAASPPSAAPAGQGALCPPGYVPRRRQRPPYDLRGKEVVSTEPPEQNPEALRAQ